MAVPKLYNWQKIKADPVFKQNFFKRAQIIKCMREYFDNQGFLEVKTPELVRLPGMEPNLNPFKTKVFSAKGEGMDAYLITSPEYAMKKLLCAGLDKIYEITSSFRNNEDLSPLHNTEFTIMEWYRTPADYNDIMKDTETMIYEVNKKINNSDFLMYKGHKIDLTPPWTRMSVSEMFSTFLNLDLVTLLEDKEKFVSQAKDKEYVVEPRDSWEDIFYKLFLSHIEPKLGWNKPVFMTEYPMAMASLSRLKASDKRFAERTEFYIGGLELGNGFSELNDPLEQERRLQEERMARSKQGKEIYDVDWTFIEALKEGMPLSSGIAVGVDRIVMLLLGKEKLEEVIMFPQGEMFEFKN